MTRLIRVGWLTAIWVALWSDISIANVLSGLAVAGIIVVLFDSWRSGTMVFRPIRVAHFVIHFLYKLVEASFVVARTVIAPKGRVRTGIVAVPLRGCSDAVATVVADAISLTPGTLTIDVSLDPLTLYVHALDTRDIEQVRRDVRVLEVLAVRAFGDDEALAGLVEDDSSVWEAK
ncbi:MAG TPA: Na+/H+ antiporter subunit E [Microthrixaceae bacterium]|nr:Na+/H+ antiporter subunit E [Microthrixaceae bacterium]